MHTYIDTTKLRNFTEEKTYDSIWEDIEDKYKITNIWDDEGESMHYIVEALYEDYIDKLANYESYIEEGMDARLLMELRKSAILNFDSSLYSFFEGHKNCNTAKEVDEYRTKYIHAINEEYTGEPWKYYYLVLFSIGMFMRGFCFDYEPCFADGDYRKQVRPEECEEAYWQELQVREINSLNTNRGEQKMLKIYLTRPDNIIDFHDQWFDSKINKIDFDEDIINFIKQIDGVEYVGNHHIKAKYNENMTLYVRELSSGCKAAINVKCFPNIVFNVGQCGKNALSVILNFKKGNIHMPYFVIPPEFENEIEVEFRGQTRIIHNNDELEDILNEAF